MVTARRAMAELPEFEHTPNEPRPEPETPRDRASGDAPPNPTFGPEYWTLGVAAAAPAFLAALGILACAGALPFVPPLPGGIVLGALLVLLGVGSVAAHAADYPAWTHPGVALIPILALFLPAAIIRGQVVTRINGDPDIVVVAPLAIAWLLMLAATIVVALVAFAIGRHAPSFSGLAILPVPLILAWLLVLAPPFEERATLGAVGTALALAAFATFIAWIVPAAQRPYIPLVAIGAQFPLFWVLRLGWPAFNGALRPVIALDIALYVALVALVGAAPSLALWTRRAGWAAARRVLG